MCLIENLMCFAGESECFVEKSTRRTERPGPSGRKRPNDLLATKGFFLVSVSSATA